MHVSLLWPSGTWSQKKKKKKTSPGPGLRTRMIYFDSQIQYIHMYNKYMNLKSFVPVDCSLYRESTQIENSGWWMRRRFEVVFFSTRIYACSISQKPDKTLIYNSAFALHLLAAHLQLNTHCGSEKQK